MLLAVVCALGSSVLYAVASVLQHRGAVSQSDEHSLRMGLLVRLAHSPAWLTGLVCDGGAYALQFVALGHGPIVVVQPLLVCGLLFALPIGAAWAGRRLSRADWTGAVLVCAGLGTFLAVSRPAAGRANTASVHWAILLVALVSLTGFMVLASLRGGPRRRGVTLAAGAGLLYGGAAALTKTTAHLLGRGVIAVLTHWEPYMLITIGVVGMLLAQSAFQAGSLDLSLPTMSVVDPVVSIAIGASLFHEAIASSPVAVLAEVVALGAMTAGVYLLARYEAARPAEAGSGSGAVTPAPAA